MINFEKPAYKPVNENIDNERSLSELADGDYIGRWYGNTFELKTGELYDTTGSGGVRCTRDHSPLKWHTVNNGKLRAKYPTIYSLCNYGEYTGKRYDHVLELENGDAYDVFDWVKTGKNEAEWHKYRIDTNYSPFVTLIDDNLDISELPDGEYKALFYANYFELCDTDEKYNASSSPMMPREWAHPEWYIVHRGHVTQKYEPLNSLEPGMYKAIMKDDLFRLKNTRTFDSYGYYLMHNAERNDGQWHIYKFDDGVLEICDDYTGKLGSFYRPPMSELPDGTYEVLEYGNKLEMRDGRIYTMPFVCKCSRELTSWKKVKIKDGYFDNN